MTDRVGAGRPGSDDADLRSHGAHINLRKVGGPARALEAILPPGAVAAEIEAEDTTFDPDLFAEERRLLEDASDSRHREFAGGRACARAALAMLGIAPLAIPAGADGAPCWPPGVIGSITHKGTYRAAAVSRTGGLAGLGVDAELDAPLPGGVLERVALPAERDQVERLAAADPTICWDRLLFSAKEAAVKAAQPLGLGRPDLRATEIVLDASASAFAASLALPGSHAAPPVRGRWLARPGLLLAVAAVEYERARR